MYIHRLHSIHEHFESDWFQALLDAPATEFGGDMETYLNGVTGPCLYLRPLRDAHYILFETPTGFRWIRVWNEVTVQDVGTIAEAVVAWPEFTEIREELMTAIIGLK